MASADGYDVLDSGDGWGLTRLPLPDEHMHPSSWRRLRRIVFLCLLLATISNVGAEHLLQSRGPNWSHRLLEAKFSLVDGKTGPADWLVLGDSSAAHGVRPDVWSQEASGGMWNLATVAGLGAMGDIWMLDRYLARFEAPGAVMVMHTVDVWDRAVDPALVGQVPGLSAWRGQTQPWPRWSWHAWRTFTLSRYLPLYAESGSLVSTLFGRALPDGLRFSMDASGWVRSRTPDAVQLRRDAEAFTAALHAPHPGVSADNARALSMLGQRCRAEGIDLYVVHAPVWEEVEPGMDARVKSVETALEAVLAPAQVHFVPRFGGVAFDALESTVDHLQPEAAAAFTKELAQRIRDVSLGTTPDGAAAGPVDARRQATLP